MKSGPLRIFLRHSALLPAVFSIQCQYDYFQNAINREKDTDNPVISQTEPTRNSVIRKLNSLRITFSEPVKNATSTANYVLSGDGLGTLALSAVAVSSESEVTLQFSGTMTDGSVSIKINGVADKVENPLNDSEIVFTSDATPKWRYIGRAVSRQTIAVNSAPSLAFDSQYLYAAISESNCINTGVTDITIMRYDLTAGTWSVVGDYCLGGASLVSTNNSSVFPALLLHGGSLFVAYTDGATYSSPNKFVRVKVFKNGMWEVLGAPLPAQVGANSSYASIAATGDNIYLSVRDLGNSGRVSVYRNTIATPGAWTLMGTNGLSAGNVFRQAPVRIFNSELYLGFRDGGSVGPTGQPSVLKWDGTSSWATIGAVDTLASDYFNLVTTASDLWAIYQQGGVASVAFKKSSGGAWSQGVTNLTTEGTPNYLSAQVNGANVYAGYQVAATTVCRFKYHDGAAWAELGSGLTCGNPSILLINGKIHAVFRDQDATYADKLSAAYFE